VSSLWILSSALAWIAIALLVALVLSLMRQVAELRAALARSEPAAEPVVGAQLYDRVEPFVAARLDDESVLTLGGEQDRPTLLVVHQPGCSTCEGIEPALEELADDPGVAARIVSVLGLTAADAADHLASRPPGGVPVITAEDLPPALMPAAVPALVALAREGLVCALGTPTALDDLREAAHAAAEAVLIGAPDSRRVTDWGVSVPFWEPAAS
jgi:hypothetical protein